MTPLKKSERRTLLLALAGMFLTAPALIAAEGGVATPLLERYAAATHYTAEVVVSFLDADGELDETIPVETIAIRFQGPDKFRSTEQQAEVLIRDGKIHLFLEGDEVRAEFNAPARLDRSAVVAPNPFLGPMLGGYAVLDLLTGAVPDDVQVAEGEGGTATLKYRSPDQVVITFDTETNRILETMVQFGSATWLKSEFKSESTAPEFEEDAFESEKLTAYTNVTPLLQRMTSTYNEEMIGKPAPDFTLANVTNGASFSLSDQKGKVVILDFWATWCPPCVESMPILQGFADEADDDVVVVGMNMDQGPTRESLVRGFLERNDIRFLNVFTSDDAASDYNVRPIPMTVVIRPDGVVHDVILGVVQKWKLQNSIVDAREAARSASPG